MIYVSFCIFSFVGALIGMVVQPWGTFQSFFSQPKNLWINLKVALFAVPTIYGGIAVQSAIWLYLGIIKDERTSIKNDEILLALLTVALIPIVEEIIFRGFLDELFKKYNLKKIGAYISSLAFGLSHPHFGATTPMGFILLYIRRRTNSVWSSVLVHSLINMSAYLGLMALARIEDNYSSSLVPNSNLEIYFLVLGILLITLGASGFIRILKSLVQD
jgi:membrane protease YdiL (CAAX protease family)